MNLSFVNGGQPTPVTLRVWVPAGVNRLRGMVLDLPGSGQTTQPDLSNAEWTGRMSSIGFGMVGLTDVNNSVWGQFGAEIETNVQTLLNAVGSTYAHPEIANAPIITTGVSKGAGDATDIAAAMAERTLCYVCDKGGYFVADYGGVGAAIIPPGLMIGGSDDTSIPPSSVRNTFTTGRALGAPVAQVIDWHVGHATTQSHVGYAFIENALRVRYPNAMQPPTTPGHPLMLTTDTSKIWLGQSNPLDANGQFVNVPSPELAPEASYTGNPDLASSLPNAMMASVYRVQNIFSKPLQIKVLSSANPGVLDLAVDMNGLTYSSIQLYHEDQLINVFGPGSTQQHMLYYPTETGLHTFIGIAQYTFNGNSFTTSSFITVGVNAVPEPMLAVPLALVGATLRRRAKAAGCQRS